MKEEMIDLKDLYDRYLFNWKWLVLSVFSFLLIGLLYYKIVPKKYKTESVIYINDQEEGGLTSELSALKDLGIIGTQGKQSVVNEMRILKSRTLIEKVVEDLNLRVKYYVKKNFFSKEEVYGANSPLYLSFLGQKPESNIDTTFTVNFKTETSFYLENEDGRIVRDGYLGDTIKLKDNSFQILKRDAEKLNMGDEFFIEISPSTPIVKGLQEKIKVENDSKKSSILTLTYIDNIRDRAIDILNNLVYQYNQSAIQYKTEVANNTDKFINDRISEVSLDLELIDRGVEEFKRSNRLTDIELESSINLQSNSELQERIVELSSQLRLVNYVMKHIDENENELIPSNLGLKDDSTMRNTSLYNELLLERNRIIEISSELNPYVINLDAQIRKLRLSIKQSLTNLKSSLEFSLSEVRAQEGKLSSKKQNAPEQERQFQDIKRKQVIVESLYLYLLEKREENAISLGIPVPNAKVIDSAGGDTNPISPNLMLVIFGSTILGLILPIGVIELKNILDTKIHSAEDLEGSISAPILNEIPKTKLDKNLTFNELQDDILSESFRLLRTNLQFLFNNQETHGKTIFVTSTLSGEGKTFVSVNLATSMALINKRVLLIGADIRKPKLQSYFDIGDECLGLTNFLVDRNLNFKDIVVFDRDKEFDFIHSGEIPPNPSELLQNGRFEELLEYAKEEYDFILVDTAPVHIVTDTILLADFADLFLYVVRADYLDKRLLKIPEELFRSKRVSNLAVVVNNSNFKKKNYYQSYKNYGPKKEKKNNWLLTLFKIS